MSSSLTQWFQSKPFAQQIIILAVLFDPLGFASGYLLEPSVDLDPLIGGVYELVAASILTSLHVMNHSMHAE
jgi:hypothetical protein